MTTPPQKFCLRTWHFELIVVCGALVAVNLSAKAKPIEWIGALAVLLSFGHASVCDRMAERQAQMSKPDVDCHKWSLRYFVGKEVLWVIYFFLHHSYSALVGCGVFLLHPIWRHWYRRRRPLSRAS